MHYTSQDLCDLSISNQRILASALQALRGVEARLKLLAARTGLSYTLTTISHEREVRVATAHDVTVAGHPG